MSGNVFEWCADWYGAFYYGADPVTNPTGPATGSYRVNRGGGWIGNANYCTVSHREYDSPDDRAHNFGFRLVLVLP